jgi:hypothetical protein
MNFKRAFIVMMALMLLPVVAFAQGVRPAPGTAVIGVNKVFSDGNDETMVTMTLECTSGTIAPASVTYLPSDGVEHGFVVSNIPVGPNNVCTVKEIPIAGYWSEARCTLDGVPNADCQPDAVAVDRLSYCQFDNVQAGDVARCDIRNNPTPVEVEVTKMWDITNAGAAGDDYSLATEITVACNAKILNNTGKKGPFFFKRFYLSDASYTAGEATVTVEVIPEYPSSDCFAFEGDVDSAVEVTSDCGNPEVPLMEVSVGEGDSCTITNTLFFEGIPTLNQYGMAIMALLMLGVGFVGFRRFV